MRRWALKGYRSGRMVWLMTLSARCASGANYVTTTAAAVAAAAAHTT